jgi:oxaloacetate decarboxylase alpha subunit
MAALTFTLSEFHTDAFYAGYAATLAASPHIDLFYLKDPSGLMSPERARTLAPAVRAAAPGKRLEVHSHCTIGLGALASLAAVEAGADAVHTAIGPLGNGSSLPEARRMIANLRERGHDVGIDDAAFDRVAEYWERLAAAEGLPRGVPQDFDATFRRHQIAGGVMTTMRRQLEEVGLAHRLPDVVAETERVRAELGFPIMVTPFPQMVCSQALFNIIGGRRYAQVSDQVIRYVMGRFGRPTRKVAADVEAAILDRPRARELAEEPAVLSLADLRRRFPATLSEEEFLLRAVMPGDQVDAMLAAGPARAHYNPEAAPLLTLLRQLAARPAARDLVVERPGWRLALHAGTAVG